MTTSDDELLAPALDGAATDRRDLRALVELADELRSATTWPTLGHDADDRARAAAIAALAGASPRAIPLPRGGARRTRRRPRRLRAALIAAVLVVAMPGTALAATWPAARTSIPGDLLYPVKLGVEQARLTLATSPASEADVHLDRAGARLDELERAEERAEEAAAADAARRYDEAVASYDALAAVVDLPDEVTARADAEFARHVEILSALLDRVPEAAKAGLARALESASRHGPPPWAGAGPPQGVTPGPPADAGPPQDAGPGAGDAGAGQAGAGPANRAAAPMPDGIPSLPPVPGNLGVGGAARPIPDQPADRRGSGGDADVTTSPRTPGP